MAWTSWQAHCLPHRLEMDIFLVIVCGFVGLWTARRAHSAFHAPLMGLTNAMSSIVAVLALSLYQKMPQADLIKEVQREQTITSETSFAILKILLLSAFFLLVINAVGGLFITHRMLKQFGGAAPSSSSPSSSSRPS